MLRFDNRDALLGALSLDLRPDLRGLLASRIRHTLDSGLGDLTHIVVLFAGDAVQDLDAELGMSLLVDPIDGGPWDARGGAPWIDWLSTFAKWWEAIVTVGDTGFAFVVLIEERDDELGRMCRAIAD